MRVMLATIALNEAEWLPRLVAQHRDWPGLVGWVFVEGADPAFTKTNLMLVSKDGLSIDGTTEFIRQLSASDWGIDKVVGLHCHNVPDGGDQGKCFLRNKYLETADLLKPDIIIVLDCDEFYTRDDQLKINRIVEQDLLQVYEERPFYTAWMFRQRHVWRPKVGTCPRCQGMKVMQEIEIEPDHARSVPLYPHSKVIQGKNWTCAQCEGTGLYPLLFSQEVVGGYWQVPHTRVWRYIPGMRHCKNHNWPEYPIGHPRANAGSFLTTKMMRCDLEKGTPECVHLGYASSPENRRAKHQYYVARGEGSEGGRMGRKRSMYLDCRSAWETWRPGDELPHGAKVIPYAGPVPECFKGGQDARIN